jgi:hypothetical protein
MAAGGTVNTAANKAGMLVQDKNRLKLKIYSYLKNRGILSEIARS